MNAPFLVSVFAAALLAVGGARAQNPPPPPAATERTGPLSLTEAVDSALVYFPTVRGAREELAGADAAVREQKSAWYPSLRLTGTATRYEKDAVVHPLHAFDPASLPPLNRSVFQGGLVAAYTLFDGGGRGARVSEARGQHGAAEEALAGTEQDLIARVAVKYSEILARRQVLDAQDRRITALHSERGRVRRLLAAGTGAAVDSLRVLAALAAADAERVRLDANLALSERDLASFTGVSAERARAANLVAVALADTAIEPVAQTVARALEQNAGVRAAGEQAAAAEAGARAARGAYWPQLALLGGYQVYGDPDGVASREWNVALQLTQNLFTGGAVSGRAANRAAASRFAQETLRLARIRTTNDVETAHDRVREAAATVQSLRIAAASYNEVARIEALSREVGSGTQTDYLNAEADLVSARARLVEAEHAEFAARLELARLTGDLTRAWLAQHLETRP